MRCRVTPSFALRSLPPTQPRKTATRPQNTEHAQNRTARRRAVSAVWCLPCRRSRERRRACSCRAKDRWCKRERKKESKRRSGAWQAQAVTLLQPFSPSAKLRATYVVSDVFPLPLCPLPLTMRLFALVVALLLVSVACDEGVSLSW